MQASRCFFTVAFLLAGFRTQAQEYSLEELTNKALTYNLSIQSSQLESSITEAKIAEVRAGALPHLTVSGDYKYYIKLPAQVIPASIFGGAEGQYAAAAFGLPWNLSTSAQASQVLYNHSLRIGLKAAKLGREVTTLQMRRTKEDVAYNVGAAYYNAQTVAQQIAFLQSNIATLDRSIRITDLRYQQKLTQGIDVDRLRLNRTSLETQVESLKAEYSQLLNTLKFLAGIPQQDSLAIRNNIDQAQENLSLGEPTVNRTELLLLERQREQNILEQKNARAGFVPSLSAYGVANYSQYAIGGDYPYSKGFPAYWVGLQLNWNVFDGTARRRQLAQKQIAGEQLALQEKQTRESITMDVSNARNQIEVQQRNLTTSRGQVALAEKVYTQSQLQLKEGTIDISTLIQNENALQEAQNNYLSSLVKLRLASLDWNKATGNLIK